MSPSASTTALVAAVALASLAGAALGATSAPDGGGYAWAGGPDGPGYGFLDIASTGTDLALTDESSARAPIGFTFPFYGQGYRHVTVDANGLVLFGDTASPQWDRQGPLPTDAIDGPAIAVFWADLVPGAFADGTPSPGRVYADTLTVDDRLVFVVQWDRVPHFNFQGATGHGPATFQAQLLPDGAVQVHFADAPCVKPGASRDSDHVVGIQAGPQGPASTWRADECEAQGGTFPAELEENGMGFANQGAPMPVPELGTLLLVAVGLLGVGAVALPRKRG